MNVTAIVNASRCLSNDGVNFYMSRLTRTGVLETVLDLLREMNVSRIQILTGYAADEIEKAVAHRGVTCITDPRWQMGGRIPWEMGLSGEEDRILLMDGCLPLITKETLEKLFDAKADVVLPSEAGGVLAVLSPKAAFALDDDRDWLSDPALCEELDLSVVYIETDDEGVKEAIHSEADLERAKTLEQSRLDARIMIPKIKLMVSKGDTFFGPGAASFFSLIDETGSMSAACKAMDMAYSRGWGMVKQVESHMGFPFLERQSGGKGRGCSKLTAKGRQFLEAYYQMEEDMKKMSEALFALHFGNKFD